MDLVFRIAGVLFAVALAVPLLFAAYPLAVAFVAILRPPRAAPPAAEPPPVSLLVVVRNASELIEAKVRNSLALDYPADRLEILIYSDGSTDATEELLRPYESDRLRRLGSRRHEGKIAGLNRGVGAARGAIVVFSDADALIEPPALRALVRHYADEAVGGVSGRTTIGEGRTSLRHAQALYLRLNGLLKRCETRAGSVTAGEGKLYSIRRELFLPIPPGVSDDFFVALSVVHQGRRFVYEEAARATIRVPSRSPAHELERRRRIVAQSLRAMALLRGVLNPLRHGFFAVGLFVNKVLRRLLPCALLLLLLTSLVLGLRQSWALGLAIAQGLFWGYALCHPAIARWAGGGLLRRSSAVAYYVALGQLGTLLGLVDFLTGRQVTRWEPLKSDVAP